MEYIYSALVLYKVGREITTEAMEAILVAADIEFDKNRVGRVCAGLKDADFDKLLGKIAVPAVLTPPMEEIEVKETEEEVEEEVEEEAPVGLSALFT